MCNLKFSYKMKLTGGKKTTVTEKKFLRDCEIAKELGVSAQKLRQDRLKGTGLPFIRLGRRILYDRAQVYEYLRSQTVQPREAYHER